MPYNVTKVRCIAIVILKLGTRMMNLKNNFHGKYQDNNCPRCLHKPDDDNNYSSLVDYIEPSMKL